MLKNDISGCVQYDCPKASRCKRAQKAAAMADKQQAGIFFAPKYDEKGCEYFWSDGRDGEGAVSCS